MKSISQTKVFHMDFPVAELFPLFSPEGEKQWVPGWNYENIMGNTELSEDYVFLTKTHDHGTTNAIWILNISVFSIRDEDDDLVAKVIKTIYVRRKKHDSEN